jgi:integrase
MIRRRCKESSCRTGRRCLEHLRFDVMFRGQRFRLPVNEFAILRMEPGKQRPVQSMEKARDWERLLIGEIKAGRDPRRPRVQRRLRDVAPAHVSDFLDAYMERCVKPAALRSIRSVQSRVAVLKQHLGELPLDAVEEPDEINAFKTESDYAEEVEIATIHRALETLRAAMNWGMAQTPPLFKKSPFNRFGVRMNKKMETTRDRRLSRSEEKLLLDTALEQMNQAEHQFVGPLLHDRIIGALELCCRRGEMLLIQNKRVHWETCQIGIPGATAKDKENRRIPFNPKGRLRQSCDGVRRLDPRPTCSAASLASFNRTFRRPGRRCDCSPMASSRDRVDKAPIGTVSNFTRSICGGTTFDTKAPGRLLADGVDIRIIQLMLGHAGIQQTQRYLNVTDEELRRGLEVSWNNKGRPLRLASRS